MQEKENKPKGNIYTVLICWALLVVVAAVLIGNRIGLISVNAKYNTTDLYNQKLKNSIFQLLDQMETSDTGQNFTLSDTDLVAPKPDQRKFGSVNSAVDFFAIIGSEILFGEDLLFSKETTIKKNSVVDYYLDDTIFAVTWKQPVGGSVYTFSEVIVKHPSQFRRFLSDGKFNSSILYTTSDMSKYVNAVVAASGDYYKYRSIGIVVNNGHVYREKGELLDTCYIDEQGDLLFTYAGEIIGKEAAENYVREHNVRFSLSFGPVMIEEGKYCVPPTYNSGEINTQYARAALCQLGKLHYVVVTANSESPYFGMPTVSEFAQNLLTMGIPTAYALDGGQTATIVMDNRVINSVSYGSEREISDIIYFATAMSGEDA